MRERIKFWLRRVSASLVIWRRSGRKLKPQTSELADTVADLPSEAPAENESILGAAVLTEVSLAIEHLQSIQVLLDISRVHRQPVPGAVFGNLDLVCKRLRQIQNRLSPDLSKQCERECVLTSSECPATSQIPPHPQGLSLEYRAFPSDT